MSDQKNEVPIRIVKKKKGGHGGHHGGAWKVAYADFVTAMMALFIVLWIVGQSKQVKEAIAGYFKDPSGFMEGAAGGGLLEGGSMAISPETIESMKKKEQEKMEEVGKEIMGELSKDASVADLSKQVNIEIIQEGMRIELLEGAKTVFFDVGTASLKGEAVRVPGIIAVAVGKMPNHLAVEGHTDSRPYTRMDGYTNFELSADRANSARRVMSARGLRAGQIDEVRGYSDTRLRDTSNPFDVSNRRVSIIIKNETTTEGRPTNETPSADPPR